MKMSNFQNFVITNATAVYGRKSWSLITVSNYCKLGAMPIPISHRLTERKVRKANTTLIQMFFCRTELNPIRHSRDHLKEYLNYNRVHGVCKDD